MSTSTRTPATERLLDSFIERQALLFDYMRSGVDRNHRFTRSLLEGARQSTRDWSEVGRRWLSNPADLIGLYEAVSEAIGNQQARALALSREWIEDVVESQREGREVLRQGIGDWREAAERIQANAPNFLRSRVWGRRNNEKETQPQPQPEPAAEA
jgi:hypothetical protein